MKEVLVIGSGAREHALVWKISQSSDVSNIYCAPGNPGISEVAECIDINATDVRGLTHFAKLKKIDLTIVGPEVSLEAGVVDTFEEEGLSIFGPTQSAARVETSKIFTKRLMRKYHIPTARYGVFYPSSLKETMIYLDQHLYPLVIKEDGLAAGKGAKIAKEKKAAREIARDYLESNKPIVVEDCLEGDEISLTALCNGRNFIPLLLSQDHKQIYPGGDNTGGMGAYVPLSFINDETEKNLYELITQKTLDALVNEGINFTGVLYSNLMLTSNGPFVLEHNARLGDPETQALLPLLESDFSEVIESVLVDETDGASLKWQNKFAVSLTLASKGYPDLYETGLQIEGIEEAKKIKDVVVFHAGTKIHDGKLVTAGGRVLSVVALGDDLKKALDKVYRAAEQIHFEGMYYRKDIASRAI